VTIIDVHNHFYPMKYVTAVAEQSAQIRVTYDKDGNPELHSPGDINVVVPGHRDLAHRDKALTEAGVDHHVFSFTCPGTVVEPPERSAELARIVNDAFHSAMQTYPGRFTALGTLPLNHPQAALREYDRVIRQLGFPGVMLYSNVNGIPLHDARFHPLYERANAGRGVFYIHPTYPVGVEAMQDYWLMPLVGFLFDTTLAAAGLVFSGVVEKFPHIRWVLGHLGGAIPYLAERLDRGFHAFADCRANISRPPSEYLRANFYYDTVNFDPRAIRFAVDFAGAGHVLAGSDYPHMIGSMAQMRAAIDAVGLSAEEKTQVLGTNAASLFHL
jgi:aminocarboxymuconate-semialdehyde decarboxylase